MAINFAIMFAYYAFKSKLITRTLVGFLFFIRKRNSLSLEMLISSCPNLMLSIVL